MEKKLLDEVCQKYGNEIVDELYRYSCLKTSGFDEDKAYELIGLLNELWLKDENNYGLS